MIARVPYSSTNPEDFQELRARWIKNCRWLNRAHKRGNIVVGISISTLALFVLSIFLPVITPYLWAMLACLYSYFIVQFFKFRSYKKISSEFREKATPFEWLDAYEEVNPGVLDDVKIPSR